MSAPPAPLALLGLGAAGRSLARWLVARGQPCPLLWNRTCAVARDLAAELGGSACAAAEEALARSEVALIALSDAALPGFVASLEPPPGGPLRAALHLAGARPPSLLDPLRRRGIAVGVFHPLAALTRAPGAPPPAGLAFGIRGDPPARAAARRLAGLLDAAVLELAEDDRAQLRYHAGAALAANGLVALFAEAEAVLAGTLEQPDQARLGLRSLLGSSLAALERLGPAQAQTGPIQRGADDLVQLHIESLAGQPRAQALYLELSRSLLLLASPNLAAQARRRLAALLGLPPGDEAQG